MRKHLFAITSIVSLFISASAFAKTTNIEVQNQTDVEFTLYANKQNFSEEIYPGNKAIHIDVKDDDSVLIQILAPDGNPYPPRPFYILEKFVCLNAKINISFEYGHYEVNVENC